MRGGYGGGGDAEDGQRFLRVARLRRVRGGAAGGVTAGGGGVDATRIGVAQQHLLARDGESPDDGVFHPGFGDFIVAISGAV